MSTLDPRPSSTEEVALLGDLMPGGPLVELAHRLGPRPAADLLWDPVADAAAVIGNLEAPLTDVTTPADAHKSNHRAAPEMIAVFDHRFVLGLANNHIMDFGPRGLEDTLGALDGAGVPYSGAGPTLADAARPARSRTPGGLDIAVVAAADGRSSIAGERTPGVCPSHPEVLRDAIDDAARGSDTVVVSVHAGIEYCAAPSRAQVDLAEVCLEAGASVVVFHHSHCLGGFLRDERGAVVLGAGNYLFPPLGGRLPRHWYDGAVWNATIDSATGHVCGLSPRAVVLDARGVPRVAEQPDRDRILRHVDRWSRRAIHGPRGTAWRAAGMLGPGFLPMAIRGFSRVLVRQGPAALWRSAARSVRSHRRAHRRSADLGW